MASGLGDSSSTSLNPQGPNYFANDISSDAGNFECNICFDLAQDPIVTLCGHLFCWPCLYKWLRIHAHSQECPVCKAIIQEEKLVPLYGRGKAPLDPRLRSVTGVDIPHRPTGQRPEAAPLPEHSHNQFHHHHHQQQQSFGLMGGIPPMAAARWGNFQFSAGIGGLFPSLFNFHLHGIPDAAAYGVRTGFHGFTNPFHPGHVHGFPRHHRRVHQADSHLTVLALIVCLLLVLALMGL